MQNNGGFSLKEAFRGFRTIALFTALSSTALSCVNAKMDTYAKQVDTRIGTGGHGHVFVGANVPFGMVQLGPTSVPQEWDWTSGYHASDSTVIGFSHTHLSGTGIGDLFDITVMPVVGKSVYERGKVGHPETGLWSYADRSKEISIPGYYSVPLTRYGILAELTATDRVGLHRYTFPKSDEAAIVLDLENGGCWDKAEDTHIEVVDGNSIRGWRHSKGWAKAQKMFFYAVFSKPFEKNEKMFIQKDGQTRYARFSFRTQQGEQVLMKVGISAVSMDGAKKAVEKEQPAWEFEKTKKQAWERWNKELSKIKIETSDESSRKIFYTALYHTMVAPSLFSDVDGAYRGADGKVYNKSRNVYTTMSLWDTYRAAMPLYHIIHPSKRADLINTMLDIFDEQGKLPVWHLMGNETDCMVGNPGVIAVAEAIVKGIEGIDKERAYKACKASVMLDERGQDIRKKYGYIPCDLYEEACANDMEYAIADAAVANAAHVLGHHEDEKFFRNRSHSWRNFFDKETQFVRGRTADGGWRTPFNPFSAEHRANDYCEGNAWQYTWLAPHDLKGLLEAFGGRDKMTHRLDSLFKAPSVLGKDASPDMSGLIGQYVHGNEPSHHIIYLYTMSGQPWKTADKVREILEGQYHAAPDGLSGNEDVGQMSAWYILTAMGFYNVEPASTKYWFGSPLFDKVSIVVSKDGKTKFDINTVNNSKENKYIQKITLNGKDWNKPYIEYGDIVKGGKLTFYMGAQPAVWYNWETAREAAK